MERQRQVEKEIFIDKKEIQSILKKWLGKTIHQLDWTGEVQDTTRFWDFCESCYSEDAEDTWEIVKDDLRSLNPFNYLQYGFSEDEVKIIIHSVLKRTIQSPICKASGFQGRLGLIYGESLKFKSYKENDGTFHVDAVVQMWLNETDYVPLLLIEFKPTLTIQSALSKGEEEIIKYAYILTRECTLDVLYGILVGIDSYMVYKCEKGKFYRSNIEVLDLPKNNVQDELYTRSFYDFFKLIVKLLWVSFERNLRKKQHVNISRGT